MDDEAWAARYKLAPYALRAHCLQRYIGQALTRQEREDREAVASGLATLAGFTDREIRDLMHLKDGQAPAGGWKEF